MPTHRLVLGLYIFGAVAALLSVILAAFTAHGLREMAPTGEQAVVWFQLATNFQMDHALGLILVAAISDRVAAARPRLVLQTAAVFLAIATVLFPGALYSLSFHGPSFFAPWGGFAAMIGWILFAVGAVLSLRRRDAA